MTIDDGRVQRMAAALREARNPRSEPTALWLQLQARIAAGDPGPAVDAIPRAAGLGATLRSPATLRPPATLRSLWRRGIVVGTLACVAAWLAWPRAVESTDASPVTATAVTVRESGSAPAPPDTPRAAATTTASPSPSPSMAQRPSAPPPAAPPRPTRSRSRPVERASARPSAPTAPSAIEADVDAELRVMRGVWAALDTGDADLALVRLDEHARRFPEGVLAVEREASRVIALCAAGTDAAARRAADAFLAAHPGSTYARRIRATCADTITNADDRGHP